MDYTKETIKNVKQFIEKSLRRENEKIYEMEDKILRIKKANSTFFEEYFVEESRKRFVMRMHGCFQCLYQFRSDVRKYLQEFKEELEREGFYVEIIMDSTGEIYSQTTQYIKDSAPSVETIQTMYLELLKVMAEYETYLRLLTNGYEPGDELCEAMKQEEERLWLMDVKKEKKESSDEIDFFKDDEVWKQVEEEKMENIQRDKTNPVEELWEKADEVPKGRENVELNDEECSMDEFVVQLMENEEA